MSPALFDELRPLVEAMLDEREEQIEMSLANGPGQPAFWKLAGIDLARQHAAARSALTELLVTASAGLDPVRVEAARALHRESCARDIELGETRLVDVSAPTREAR